MPYLGLDTMNQPTPDQLAWIESQANMCWIGYYLAPTPCRKDMSWMGNRANLLAKGWRPVLIYLPTAPATVVTPAGGDAQQGSTDGMHAASLASTEGFVGGYIYLDIKDGSTLSLDGEAYVEAWINGITAKGYRPGIYCSHVLADSVTEVVGRIDPIPKARLWVFKVDSVVPHRRTGSIANLVARDPADSGVSNASAWQFEQDSQLDEPVRGKRGRQPAAHTRQTSLKWLSTRFFPNSVCSPTSII
ncbi:glycoside hydrolase domain-containing protein [Undibacterium sp. Di26W]|uniref:glycoside hydrolase domain-containing protein n=1 Tax=Undibacterium sp. Di26W TaxID=3413035 RepID=UPI003BF0829B